MLEEIRHRFIDKFIGNAFFGLVFIGSLRGKGGRNQNQAVLHILKRNFALVFQVFPCCFKTASIWETNATLTAFSGAPPCSKWLELW